MDDETHPRPGPSIDGGPRAIGQIGAILLLIMGFTCLVAIVGLQVNIQSEQQKVRQIDRWLVQLESDAPSPALLPEMVSAAVIAPELAATVHADSPSRTELLAALLKEHHTTSREIAAHQESSIWVVMVEAILLFLGGGLAWSQHLRMTRKLTTARNRQREAETEADNRRRLLELAFNAGPFGLHLFASDGRPLHSMPNISRQRGLQSFDFVAMGVKDIRKHPVLAAVNGVESFDRAANGETVHSPIRHLNLPSADADDNRVMRVSFTVSFIPVLNDQNTVDQVMLVVQDETDQELLRSQLRQVERLAEVGSLAAGTARELASPLRHLQTHFGQLENFLAAAPGAHAWGDSHLPDIYHSLEHIRRIARDLTELAEAASEPSEATPLEAVVQRVAAKYRATLPDHIQLDLSLSSLPTFSFSARRFEQILGNLITNAAQACGTERSTIWITGGTTSDRECWVEITDNGSGMVQEIQNRIFEPFFTTRSAGEGTGLGLYLVHCYVEELGGSIRVRSRPGEGTSVRIELPYKVLAPRSQTSPLQGLRLLVLDPDQSMVHSVRQLLPEVASIVHAPSSSQAVVHLRAEPPIDRILATDSAQVNDLAEQIGDPELLHRAVMIPGPTPSRATLEETLRLHTG